MSNDFRGEGNLGAQPTLKKVLVDGEPHSVAELRIFFDRFKSDGQGSYVPNGGFWLTGSIWDQRAEACVEHLQRSARVHARSGTGAGDVAGPEDGRRAPEFRLNLDAVYHGVWSG
ncbi:MAG: single-stranded DNA-binding protein [Betaproteobacteria bacterium]|nr:single-stranded DNA-binding protein [Betaproteobacteria bacterium]